MDRFETLMQRNRAFAQTDAKDKVPAIPFIPNRQLYVLTCIDPRVDPAAVLGLDLGDAIVARNIGGRVTDSILADLAWVCHLHQSKTPDADWFELAVIHHDDCGSALLADEELRRSFTDRFGYDDQAMAAQAVLDPVATVRADVAKLLAAPQLASGVVVHGYSYDLKTGLLTQAASPSTKH